MYVFRVSKIRWSECNILKAFIIDMCLEVQIIDKKE